MATQDGDPELQPSIRDIDYTQGQISILLTTQKNDQERYALAEKIILELVNKNKRLLKERQALLEARGIERKELLDKNDKLLVMSVHQLVGHAIDSGIGLSITIDKLRVFINKTLSILSAYQ